VMTVNNKIKHVSTSPPFFPVSYDHICQWRVSIDE